ncbi:MAG: SIR2 family protein [Rhizobiaceae bacterium]
MHRVISYNSFDACRKMKMPGPESLTQECGPKCLPFLRQRFRKRRLGILAGAGISIGCGIPSWAGLVARVRKISTEPPNHLICFDNASSATFLTEVAWRRFRKEKIETYASEHPDERYLEALVESEWLREVKKALFSSVTNEKIQNHPYLSVLARIIHKGCPFNISFNFDNLLDIAVAEYASSINEQLPTTTASIAPIDRQYGATIFHINGLMPIEKNRKATELIFSEDAFARILTTEDVRKKEYLLNQLAEKTFILIGLSLNDKSLTNILRASKDRNPGCHHCYIHYLEEGSFLNDQEMKEIYDANLHVYNLVTLFLSDRQISQFLNLETSEYRSVIGLGQCGWGRGAAICWP